MAAYLFNFSCLPELETKGMVNIKSQTNFFCPIGYNKSVQNFPKNLSHQNEAYEIPSKRKKMRQEKWKKREERKQKVTVKKAVSLLNPKSRNLLSVHAQTSQANILHLDQKVVK